MTKTKKITPKQYQILEILWNSDKPLLLADILKETHKRQIADNSVSNMIRTLIEKGYVKVVGEILVGKQKCRFYSPAISIDEFAAMQLRSIYKSTKHQPDISRFLSYFTRKNDNEETIIKDIENFVDNYKQKKE